MLRLTWLIPSGARQLQRLLNRWACLMFALAAGYGMPAAASLVANPPVATVGVFIGAGYPVGLVNISSPAALGEPIFAQGKIVWAEPDSFIPYAAGVDIYFGVIMPGGTTAQTWSPDNTGKVTLNDGFAPIARARSVSSPGTFDTTSVNSGEPITYMFSGSEPKGLYLVFIFMVPAGADPTDVEQWGRVEMEPFYVK